MITLVEQKSHNLPKTSGLIGTDLVLSGQYIIEFVRGKVPSRMILLPDNPVLFVHDLDFQPYLHYYKPFLGFKTY